MPTNIDHMILPVNELEPSIAFYCDILGFETAGTQGPFTNISVSDAFVLLLSPFGTRGGMHLAFNYGNEQFDDVFNAVQKAGIPYGDNFDAVGNMKGPSPQPGATGDLPGFYVNDPDNHLIEVRRR